MNALEDKDGKYFECGPCGRRITAEAWMENGYACPYCSPRAKHALRNPVDVQLERANAVAAIGRAYDRNKEEQRKRGAAENDNALLRSSLQQADRVIAELTRQNDSLSLLVNESHKRITMASWLGFLIGAAGATAVILSIL